MYIMYVNAIIAYLFFFAKIKMKADDLKIYAAINIESDTVTMCLLSSNWHRAPLP